MVEHPKSTVSRPNPGSQTLQPQLGFSYNWMRNDAIVGNPDSASLCLRGTGKREGREKTQPLEGLQFTSI